MMRWSLFAELAKFTIAFAKFGSYARSVFCSGSLVSTDSEASEMKISGVAYCWMYFPSHFDVA